MLQNQSIDHIQKCFRTKVSVFEKAVILDHPIFLSVEALKLRQRQLHFLKWNHVYIGKITFKGSTNLGLGLPTEDARSDDPRLVSTC